MLCGAGYMLLFCRGVSCCEYCDVGITFAFLCLPEDVLGRLDSRFSLTICQLMTRTAWSVLKGSFSSELSELWRGDHELRSVFWDDNIRNAVSCKVAPYTRGCFGITEPVIFPEIGEIVHSDKIILVVKIADVYCDVFPWPVSGLMAHQCFLGLLSWILAAYFTLGYEFLYFGAHSWPRDTRGLFLDIHWFLCGSCAAVSWSDSAGRVE